MKPEIDQILGTTAGQLMTEIAPLIQESYSQSTAGLLGLMLTLAAQEYERGADIRATENADILALLAALGPSTADGSLKTRLADAASEKEASLKISDLNAANARLKTLLIALQSDCEARGDKSAQQKIWAVLRAAADRRLVKLPGM